MKIEVKSSSKQRREFIEACAKFYKDKLNLGNSTYYLTIRSVSGMHKAEGWNGLVNQGDGKEIVMFLDNQLSLRKLIYTLAHEMVHVKQIAKGHYAGKCLRNGKVVPTWKGKVVQAKYLDRPWEIEAFKRESILAEMLFEYAEKRQKKAKNKKK